MTFQNPTTKEQMFEVLQQIYRFYRIEREDFTGTELQPLALERMAFLELTDDELLLKAKALLSGKKQRETTEYKSKIDQEIAGLNAKIDVLGDELSNSTEQVNKLYEESEKKVEEQARKNGISNSSIVGDKLTQVEEAKNLKIIELNGEYTTKLSNYNSQLAELETKKSQAQTYFDELYLSEESSKVIELKDEQDKILREVFKYNNSLEEKEIKYGNSIAKSNLELKLKFLEIQSIGLTKEQLVKIGYYDDVLTCVYAYYDTLDPIRAYQDIVEEERLMIFLDDYYQNVIYLYKMRAT